MLLKWGWESKEEWMDRAMHGREGRGMDRWIDGRGRDRPSHWTEMYKVSSSQYSVFTTVVAENVRKPRSLHKCRHSSINGGKDLRSPGSWVVREAPVTVEEGIWQGWRDD